MNALIVDGGGTKTRAWLVDRTTKEVLRLSTGGPSNINSVGADGLCSVLESIRTELAEQQPAAAVFGLAGVGRVAEEAAATDIVRTVFPNTNALVTTDAHLAYAGAFESGRHGILIIAGTGSIGFYQNPSGREFFRAGGWGPLLGDEGGGAWLGREVLRHCLWEWETEELSPFHEAVLEQIAIESPDDILTRVYSGDLPPARWATLAPLVFRFAREDPGAMRILRKAAVHLIGLAERLIEDLPQSSKTIPLVITGGLWERRDLLEPLLIDEIDIRNLPLAICEPVGGPLEGGLALLNTMSSGSKP